MHVNCVTTNIQRLHYYVEYYLNVFVTVFIVKSAVINFGSYRMHFRIVCHSILCGIYCV